MHRSFTSRTLLPASAILFAATSANAAPVFTGDVLADFTEPGVQRFADPGGVDVGVPLQFPAGTISGNDLRDVRVFYDANTDVLHIGLDTYGIAGDVDGDGDPDRTSALLASLGGADLPQWGGTESFAVYFDLDEDGTYDVIAGIPALQGASGFQVARFSGTPYLPSFAFGAPLPAFNGGLFAVPSASRPDLELRINDFSRLPTSSGFDLAPTLRLAAFVGSLSDAGIGEDFNPGANDGWTTRFDRCGDGRITVGEACDDGNSVDGDGCSAACVVEFCGDGVAQAGEACDDGGDVDGDGCSSACEVEFCGDGVVQPGEACDDGNPADGDGCNRDCSVTPPEICDGLDNDGDGVADDGLTVLGSTRHWRNDRSHVFNAGVIERTSADFDPIAQRLTFSTTIRHASAGQRTNGFWMAINDGPNPKGHAELALFYFDASGPAPQLTVYAYNGQNGDTSWRDGSGAWGSQPSDPIASSLIDARFVRAMNAVDDGQRVTMSFTVDVAAINAHLPTYVAPWDWTGARFGDTAGLWFHHVSNLRTAYTGGWLSGWTYDHQGWIDTNDEPTTGTPICAAVCGNGVIEAGESCDDRNTTPGDGCEADCQPTPPPEVCNAIDDDGDGATDEGFDADHDGIADCLEICPNILDFERDAQGRNIVAGQDLGEVYAAYGVHLVTWNDQAMVSPGRGIAFDSANPTGGDHDLRTPGYGANNTSALGNLWISAENFVDANADGLVDDPDDDVRGAWYEAKFDQPTCIAGFDLVDLEGADADVVVYGPAHQVLRWIKVRPNGDNGVQHVAVDTCGAHEIMIDVYGTGAVDNLDLCVGGQPEVCDGSDNDGDGDRDEGFADTDHDGIADCVDDRCGDGVVSAGEACDDGNLASDDGCSASCADEFCGDGVRQPDEACDDGNNRNDDGCAADCLTEACGDGVRQASEACDDGNSADNDGCSAACVIEVCGDGVRQAGEACDDGDVDSGDGCTANCDLEFCADGVVQPALGEQCDDGNTRADDGCGPSCAVERCGDGVRQGAEQCDDGANNAGDGCDDTCRAEVCGNGVVDAREQCDDGNTAAGDGCEADCHFPEVCNGVDDDRDGVTDEDGACDDCALYPETAYEVRNAVGNGADHALWLPGFNSGNPAHAVRMKLRDDARIRVDANGDARLTGTAYVYALGGGPGALHEAWQLDVRLDYRGRGAAGQGWGGPKLELPAGQQTAAMTDAWDYFTLTSGTLTQIGGDDVATLAHAPADERFQCQLGVSASGKNLNDGFACWTTVTRYDGGALRWRLDGDINLDATALPPCACGDGEVQAGEACDDGNHDDNDGCDRVCEAEVCGDGRISDGIGEACDDGNATAGDGCDSTCQVERCGDGRVSLGEACDDGNAVPTDGCTNACALPVCGDAIVSAGEACDDGNSVQTDGCTNACALPVCGDAIVSAGEACDDGNTLAGDGCASCALEVCGDGVIAAGEACDDGNLAAGDGCDEGCFREICGDGITQPGLGEQCDDRNNAAGDGCSSTCQIEPSAVCGDGRVQAPEQCDDGNTRAWDGCSATCRVETCAVTPGLAQNYAAFVRDDFLLSPESAAPVAAGDTIEMEGFNVGFARPGLASLVAGNTLHLNDGTVWGDAWYGATAHSDDWNTVTFQAGGALRQGRPFDWDTEWQQVQNYSVALSVVPQNTTTTWRWGGLQLTGNYAFNVYRVLASDLARSTWINIKAPPNSTNIVRVVGASAQLHNLGITLQGPNDGKVLWQFPTATSIDLEGIELRGSILAPYADVYFDNGNLKGSVWSRSMTGSAELYWVPWTGSFDCARYEAVRSRQIAAGTWPYGF